MNSEAWSIVLGLASAASWGAGDFSGGLASKRSPVYGVIALSQLVGLALLGGLALLLGEPPPPPAALRWGALAGLGGGLGLLFLYHGLATGHMGVVAPVSAVVTAAVPVLFGAWLEGAPTAPQLAGFGLALASVAVVSRAGGTARVRWRDLGLPLLAGLGFGAFFVAMGRASESAALWPLVAARLASISLLLVISLARRSKPPPAGRWPLIAVVGLFDSGGNAFYVLAAQAGRFDVAAVLGSLYPAVTVLLARLVLKEPISRVQWLGVALAIAAVGLIAA